MTVRAFARQEFDMSLREFEAVRPLPGIDDLDSRMCFIEQLVDSTRRIEYVHVIRARQMGASVADPRSDSFDPLKAAVREITLGNHEEAFWLVFLFVHFGKPLRSGWRLARDVYAGPSRVAPWNWAHVSADPVAFSRWLAIQAPLWKVDGVRRQFGNHRKYESLSTTGAVVESYVRWVHGYGTHQGLVKTALVRGTSPAGAFDELYRSMEAVTRFGRTAKFDYLTMLGKLALARIEPGVAYLNGATGPRAGALLLFSGQRTGSATTAELERWLVELGARLSCGQQVLEDALCNWQKSPSAYVLFRG